MKKAVVSILLFLMVFVAYTQEINHQNISQAVLNSLPEWLARIPVGDEISYGFQNREEFSRAVLGTPVEVFVLGKNFYTQTDREIQLTSIGEWRIPVVVDQKNCALVTVIKQNGEWKIVDFGAAGLAGELNNFGKQLTDEQFRKIKMIRIYQPLSDFLFYDDPLSNPDQIVLLPFRSASQYLESQDSQTKKTWTLSEVATILHKLISIQNQE
ncbi:MAG: hypothetical protein M0P47_10995 [Bacteroidales bacterium]|nr:hypothetical protein [Bacteroidales bacterium]